MELDTKQGSLSFFLNDWDMGVAFESEYLREANLYPRVYIGFSDDDSHWGVVQIL